jgi:glucokinase
MAHACIGIDLGGSKVHVGVVDRAGHVHAERRAPTGGDRRLAAVLDAIARLADACVAEAQTTALAVGVGVAGQVDTAAGVVRSSPNLPTWIDVPLARELRDRLGLPVIATNDLRAIARGEWRFGGGRGVSDLVVLFVCTGVGGAVISGNRPLLGIAGYAGELGHMPNVAGGRKCHCPGRGCVEAYVSGWALAERSKELLAAHPEAAGAFGASDGAISAHHLAAAYAAGNPFARDLVAGTGAYLGIRTSTRRSRS